MTIQCILLTLPYKGLSAGQVAAGFSEKKKNQSNTILLFAFLLSSTGGFQSTRMDLEHGVLLRSKITTGNVFPGDVTVNTFSAEGNKSFDFEAVRHFFVMRKCIHMYVHTC